MRIQRRWRSELTKVIVSRWIANGRYYQLNLIDRDHQNTEARLSEDMRIATEAPVDFVAGVIAAFVSVSTFIVVLWTIGGALTLPVGGLSVMTAGFLVIAAVIYAVITSSSIALIGRNFVRGLRGQELVGGGIPLDVDPCPGKRGEQCSAWRRRGGGAKRPRQEVPQSPAPVEADGAATYAHHRCVIWIDVDCARCSASFVRAQISRCKHVARPGHAGRVRFPHRSIGLRLAGRQLSPIGGPEHLRTPRCLSDDVTWRAEASRRGN